MEVFGLHNAKAPQTQESEPESTGETTRSLLWVRGKCVVPFGSIPPRRKDVFHPLGRGGPVRPLKTFLSWDKNLSGNPVHTPVKVKVDTQERREGHRRGRETGQRDLVREVRGGHRIVA